MYGFIRIVKETGMFCGFDSTLRPPLSDRCNSITLSLLLKVSFGNMHSSYVELCTIAGKKIVSLDPAVKTQNKASDTKYLP